MREYMGFIPLILLAVVIGLATRRLTRAAEQRRFNARKEILVLHGSYAVEEDQGRRAKLLARIVLAAQKALPYTGDRRYQVLQGQMFAGTWLTVEGSKSEMKLQMEDHYRDLVAKASGDVRAFQALKELIVQSRESPIYCSKTQGYQYDWIIHQVDSRIRFDYPPNWNDLVVRYVEAPEFGDFDGLPGLAWVTRRDLAHRMLNAIEFKDLRELAITLAYCYSKGWAKAGVTETMYEQAMRLYRSLRLASLMDSVHQGK